MIPEPQPRRIVLAYEPIIPTLRKHGIEPDQRLRDAVAACGERRTRWTVRRFITDAMLFYLIHQLNSSLTRYISAPLEQRYKRIFGLGKPTLIPVEEVRASGPMDGVINTAIARARNKHTLGTRDFLRTVVTESIEYRDDWQRRPHTADVLAMAYGYDHTAPLSQCPEVLALLKNLQASLIADEDYQYMLALENGVIRFRVASTLDDYVQENDSGLWVPHRAMLQHIDQLGWFTADSIHELEDLLNSSNATENDFQEFFERYPLFLRTSDYREVYPHLYLTHTDDGPLIPDFILTDRELQKAAIAELKLPGPKLIRRQRNRERFADAVMAARAQLLTYREWFRDKHNRLLLKQSVKMEIYEPHMMVIIGRSSDFQDEFDRQRLMSRTPDIQIVTYDDILTQARRRMAIIEGP